MDVLTDHEIEGILQRLEALATELEHDVSVRPFYTFVLTAQAFAETKHALSSLAHLHRCLALAHRFAHRCLNRFEPLPRRFGMGLIPDA